MQIANSSTHTLKEETNNLNHAKTQKLDQQRIWEGGKLH